MNQLPNLLIVDDLEVNLELLESIIKKIDVNLIRARSGAEALQKVKGIELALAIIDVQMPVMNGYDLAKKLNEERSDNKVPVIFLTANYFDKLEVFKGYSSGAVDYIFKPVASHILQCKINIFLDLFKQKQMIISHSAQLRESSKELIKATNVIKKSEKKYRSYIDNAPDGVFIFDETGHYIEVNQAASRITGYSKNELLKMSILDILQKESIEEWLFHFYNTKTNDSSKADLLFNHKNGSKRWCHLEFVKLTETRFLGFAKDITERIKTIQELKDSEANLAEAQLIAHIGSWEWDLKTNNVKWSREMYHVFGLNPDLIDAKLETLQNMVHPEDIGLFINNLNSSNPDGNIPSLEYRVILRDGSLHYIFSESRNVFDVNGKPVKKKCTAQDITERKKAEAELKRSLEELHKLRQYTEKVRENERVAISRELHDDLGQALTAINIDLSIIKQQITDNEVILKLKKVTAHVIETIKTVQRLTSQLRPEIINDLGLEAAIEWYTNDFAQRNKIRILFSMNSTINFSQEASLTIFRIIQESLTNIARHAKATKVEIAFSKKGEYLNLSIIDNGVGISETDLQSKKSFGIIIMKERAASLGGSFDIYRNNDQGTVIKLILPITN